MNIDFFLDWFSDYTNGMRKRIPLLFETNGVLDEFDMKVEHTYKVQARCEKIAHWLNLSGVDFNIASMCGLFHDLGRFEQAVQFGTMDDRITGSHADMSETIFMRDVSRQSLTDRENMLIAAALRCHNLFALPEGLDGETLLFAKLIRDADKLDIFRHIIDLITNQEKRMFRHVPNNAQGEINPVLIDAVLRGENLNAAQVRNGKDRKLMEISMIFNLNYGYSFQQVLEMRFIEQTAEAAKLPEEQMAAVTAYATAYARERVGQR